MLRSEITDWIYDRSRDLSRIEFQSASVLTSDVTFCMRTYYGNASRKFATVASYKTFCDFRPIHEVLSIKRFRMLSTRVLHVLIKISYRSWTLIYKVIYKANHFPTVVKKHSVCFVETDISSLWNVYSEEMIFLSPGNNYNFNNQFSGKQFR